MNSRSNKYFRKKKILRWRKFCNGSHQERIKALAQRLGIPPQYISCGFVAENGKILYDNTI